MVVTKTEINIAPKVIDASEVRQLKELSTEKLIVWIIGKSNELGIRLTREDVVLECWAVNPDKHSLRGYPQYLCSHTVLKRLSDMKGKRGVLSGPGKFGYSLTEVGKIVYADLKALIREGAVLPSSRRVTHDRSISDMDEAPYRRLKKTPAYEKLREGHPEQMVEMDFLYFYGINWHTKATLVHGRLKNVNAIVAAFSQKDPLLKEVHRLLNDKYADVREKLLKSGEIKHV